MDIQAEKIALIKLLLDTDNPEVIKSIKYIFKKEEPVDFYDALTPEQQQEIKDASLEIEQGKTTDYESFMAKHQS